LKLTIVSPSRVGRVLCCRITRRASLFGARPSIVRVIRLGDDPRRAAV
jgi:hypothetical protein